MIKLLSENYFRKISISLARGNTKQLRAIARMLINGKKIYRWTGPSKTFAAAGDFFLPLENNHDPATLNNAIQLDKYDISLLELMSAPQGALLWDQSFIWGLIAYESMVSLGFNIHLITRQDIINGRLKEFDCLCVPGGWASQKSRSLGNEGKKIIRDFVRAGGTYLGFCGGAGFALNVPEGLGLLPVSRQNSKIRLPNFSGPVKANLVSDHSSLGLGLDNNPIFHVWWPSQFYFEDKNKINILATYGKPENDFYVADLNVADINTSEIPWKVWESRYGIKLSPDSLKGEPAIISSTFGKGTVIASYFHLETPGDRDGNLALFNLWHQISVSKTLIKTDSFTAKTHSQMPKTVLDNVQAGLDSMTQIINLGERAFLWYWRNDWLLKWKRKVRGLEFCSLYILIKGVEKRISHCVEFGCLKNSTCPGCQEIENLIIAASPVFDKFINFSYPLIMNYLFLCNFDEKNNSNNSVIEKNKNLEKKLFGRARSGGGLYFELIQQISDILVILLSSQNH